jgi:hypothetical protein
MSNGFRVQWPLRKVNHRGRLCVAYLNRACGLVFPSFNASSVPRYRMLPSQLLSLLHKKG